MPAAPVRTAPGPSTAAAIVHDLHAPLTIIRGLCAALARDDPRFDRRRVAEMLDAEALRLADGLRALAHAGGGERGDAPVTDLAEVARVAADRFAAAAAVRDVVVVRSGARRSTWVAGPRPDLERAVDNVVRNAVRHAPAGGRVLIGLARRGDRVILRVRDDGPGVPPADRRRIFLPGERGSDAPGPGDGLGLSIARELAERSGGTLTLDPVGEGACFRFAFPAAGPPTDVTRAA